MKYRYTGLRSANFSPMANVLRIFLWLTVTAVTSKQTECIFYEGATFVTICDGECCENKCCEEPVTDSTGMIVGIAVGSVVLLVVILAIVVCFTKNRWRYARCKKKIHVDIEEDEEEPGTSTGGST